ncbi:alpha-L-fucosidase 2 [Fusarium globosum]|uniref:Alpha-L-fucosidase 2 n=1 Tax=Fusarium globosum TaxID=78864 RepID=A0A8H5XQH0_9HYPO|nr:alpha-L-fucosidase 2 [Fusarium globosum]
MDPASAIGTTSAVLSFVDFICKVTKTGYELYDASNGTLDEYERLKTVTASLDPSLQSLRDGTAAKGRASLSNAERVPSRRENNCQLLSRLRRIGKASRASIQIVWTRSEAKALRDEFTACTTQLSIHLVVIARSEILAKLEDLIRAGNKRDGDVLDLRDIVSPLGENLDNLRHRVSTSAAELCSMVKNLQRQSNNDRDAWGQSIEQIRNFYQVSQGALQAMNHQCILDGISFPGMNTKRATINEAPASKGTYEWLLYDESIPESHTGTLDLSFRRWLLQGHGIFHIAGKPGSGKSTLMNLISHHKETVALLDSWAGDDGKKLIKCIVCLSKPGLSLEKSMEGLQRTLLHSILDQARQSLISQAFPQFWNPENWSSLKLQSDTEKHICKEDVEAGLEVLFTDPTSKYRFCIFVDGADEFEDPTFPKWKLAVQLLLWVRGNVKICVSSREEDPWITRFQSSQRIMLHAVTMGDIRKAIENDLLKHPEFEHFLWEDQIAFIQKFVKEANGVFIWVKLVLRYITEKLDHGEDIQELYRTLTTLPKPLESFYEMILDNVPESDRKEAYTILYSLLLTKPPHRTFLFSFIRKSFGHERPLTITDRGHCGDQPWLLQKQLKAFERRLPLLLKGMITSVMDPRNVDINLELLRTLELPPHLLEISHRSIYEFLQRRVNRITFSAADPRLAVIQGLTQAWKASEPFVSSMMNYDILAFLLKWLRDNFKDDCTAVFQQLSELDSWLFQSQHTGNWNTFRQFETGHRTAAPRTLSVLATAARVNFVQYLRWELTNSNPPWMHLDSVRASLLRVSYSDWDMYDELTCLECLLQLDFSPNSKGYTPDWHDRSLSAWQVLISKAWMDKSYFDPSSNCWDVIAKHLEYGAVVPVAFRWELDHSTYDHMFAIDQVDQCRVSICKSWIDFGPNHGAKETVQLKAENMSVPTSLAREFPGGISLWQLYERHGPIHYQKLALKVNYSGPRHLWYDSPGSDFRSPLPIGNGRLGALVQGSISGKIIINENSVWSGPFQDRINPGSLEAFPKARKLLTENDYTGAAGLASDMYGIPPQNRWYSVTGNLLLEFGQKTEEVSNYERWLDPLEGNTGISYDINGVTYTREVVANFPLGVIAARFTASKDGTLNIGVSLERDRGVISNLAKGGANNITMDV